ncbi:hypothetical protein GGP66_002995 [Salinibacter ruber]|uniref:Uncharacterized protein n=1 Tax=Salinibacter ruber TaxID=146919 RepID=A0A9X2ZEC1_9BACT|nr:hypothetical protein [Salinibacter ruber]MCS3616348.1 hypothetical protein [Salinibacter ruber]MCS3675548.1 hypothetical protein [Salinibacter ruber]MCS3785358.1 hypothetical protein [Salinibacter ruber]MCS4037914.1 hypothetical protein [Salinibacter ruber]
MSHFEVSAGARQRAGTVETVRFNPRLMYAQSDCATEVLYR